MTLAVRDIRFLQNESDRRNESIPFRHEKRKKFPVRDLKGSIFWRRMEDLDALLILFNRLLLGAPNPLDQE